MSLSATTYVLHRRFGNHIRKLLMIAIADFANDAGEAWPSIDTLADRAECSRRSVQEHLGILQQERELEVNPNAGRYGTHLYRILFKKSEQSFIPSAPVQRGDANPAPPTSNRGANAARGMQMSVAQTAKGGANERRQFAPESSGTVREQSKGGEEHPSEQLAAISRELAATFPSSPQALVGAEEKSYLQALPVLHELTAEDWLALRCWMRVPQRIRGRSLWPRDRAEFLANAGQATELIRNWWKRDGKSWHAKQQPRAAPAKPQPPPQEPTLSPEEIKQLLTFSKHEKPMQIPRLPCPAQSARLLHTAPILSPQPPKDLRPPPQTRRHPEPVCHHPLKPTLAERQAQETIRLPTL